MTTTTDGSSALTRGRTSTPASPGMRWSSMTRSTSRCARISSAAAPCSASSTSHVSSRMARMEARTPSSSSTTSTVPRRRVVSGGPLSRSFIGFAVGAAAQSSAARRSGTQYVASFRRPPIEDDVLVAGVGAGAMEVEQRGLAGRDRGQCLAERLCVADGLTPDLEDHVAAPKTAAGGRTACGDVDDEATLRDGEVEPVGDAGRERLDVQPEAVLARLGPHGRLLRRHLADRHRGRLARTVAHDDDAHALARGEPGDAPLQVGHLADAHTVDLDNDVAGP